MVAKLSYTNYPLSSQIYNQHGGMVEEIEGLIRVFRNGHVERPLLVPNVPCTVPYELGITCKDVVIDNFTKVWARLYTPTTRKKLPLLVYFHGGGFCVGSASWGCYHDFLANLASKAGCVIIAVNYRLAPENRLPAAYEDGANAITWVKQHASSINGLGQCCNFSSLFLAGDSAGANIAHHVSTRVEVKGTILIQPFFGGEARTKSEKNSIQPPNSALTLSSSDTYWRLALPIGANRDHPWCNPMVKGEHRLRDLRLAHSTMVCVSEMDILKDRNLDFCSALADAGNRVQTFIYKDVGHAFQVLHNCPMSQYRTRDMMFHLKAFINQ